MLVLEDIHSQQSWLVLGFKVMFPVFLIVLQQQFNNWSFRRGFPLGGDKFDVE